MPQKYYAVKVGKKPGIYVDYHAFAQQMRGYKNAQGKAFKTETEARQYLGPAHWDDTVVTAKVKIAKLESENLSLQLELKALKKENQRIKTEPFKFLQPDENGDIQDRYVIFTDGSCIHSSSNEGIGSWAGIIIHFKEVEYQESYGMKFFNTSSSHMEIMAVNESLKQIPEGATAMVYTDCESIVNAEKGIFYKPITDNPTLWSELEALCKKRTVKFGKVKAHTDNPFNNRCDEIARSMTKAFKPFQERLLQEKRIKEARKKLLRSGSISQGTYLKKEPPISMPATGKSEAHTGLRIESYDLPTPAPAYNLNKSLNQREVSHE